MVQTHVILYCGTNNLRSDTPEQIVENLKKIETEIKNICPSMEVIISSLTCCFDSEMNQEAVGKINTLLSEYFLSECIITHINIK